MIERVTQVTSELPTWAIAVSLIDRLEAGELKHLDPEVVENLKRLLASFRSTGQPEMVGGVGLGSGKGSAASPQPRGALFGVWLRGYVRVR